MVVFRSGASHVRTVRARAARVRVGGRRCTAGAGTPLAVLVRARPGQIGLRDFGRCSRRSRDGGGLFVRSIRRERNRGQDGWVYKVGRRLGTAGAADPAGPFGSGRLRSGSRVLWFYCRLRGASCQRTLAVRARVGPDGAVGIRVTGVDDEGGGVRVEGASVRLGGFTARSDSEGFARFRPAAGSYRARATKPGLIPSFPERVGVR